MNDQSTKLFPANELVGSFLSDIVANDIDVAARLQNDAEATLLEIANLDFSGGGFSVSVVQNSHKQIHLALPYYTAVEDISQRAAAMSDENLDGVAGGEIIFSIIGALVGTLGAIGAAVGAGSATAAAAVGASIAVGGIAAGAATGLAGAGAAIGAGAAVVGVAAATGAAAVGIAGGVGAGIATGAQKAKGK